MSYKKNDKTKSKPKDAEISEPASVVSPTPVISPAPPVYPPLDSIVLEFIAETTDAAPESAVDQLPEADTAEEAPQADETPVGSVGYPAVDPAAVEATPVDIFGYVRGATTDVPQVIFNVTDGAKSFIRRVYAQINNKKATDADFDAIVAALEAGVQVTIGKLDLTAKLKRNHGYAPKIKG